MADDLKKLIQEFEADGDRAREEGLLGKARDGGEPLVKAEREAFWRRKLIAKAAELYDFELRHGLERDRQSTRLFRTLLTRYFGAEFTDELRKLEDRERRS